MFDRLILFVTASPLRRCRYSQNTKRGEPVTICTGIFRHTKSSTLQEVLLFFARFLSDCCIPLPCGAAASRPVFNVYH